MVMRKHTRNRRIFPYDDAALKAMYLAVREASKNWKSIHHWKPALQSFQVIFGEDRVPGETHIFLPLIADDNTESGSVLD